MAIYKNREVSVGTLTPSSTTTNLITITYKTGETENVALGAVRFTQEEKDQLQKDYTKGFNDTYFKDLPVVTDEDLKSVRLGVAPSYDKEAKELAESRALAQKAAEQNQKTADQRKAEADKNLDKKLDAPTQVQK